MRRCENGAEIGVGDAVTGGTMQRNRVLSVAVMVLIAACSPSAEDTTTSSSTTTTTAPTTTTTIDPATVAAATCAGLKVAAFDLDAAVTSGFADLDPNTDDALADAAVGLIVVEGLVAFYDEIGAIAEDAPTAIADELSTVSAAVDPWRDALTGDPALLEETLQDLDPAALSTPEVDEAIETLDEWTTEICGSPIPLDAEEIIFTTVFSAMLGAIGNVFGDLGDDFVDPNDDPVTEIDEVALVYGDDPNLDDLYTRCGNGDGTACRDLSYTAYGEYELWGQTCGASIPLRPKLMVDCHGKFASPANAYGDGFVLDTLWDECEADNLDSCDRLFAASRFGSVYEEFGATCGRTREPGDFTRPCAFVVSGEPYGYGDAAEFDILWDTCSAGDADACYDLFLETPISSAYEAFGRVCGDLSEMSRPCENAATWLAGPLG